MLNPWHLLATGFGSRLSPVVPGTMGSLAAIPFWYLTFLPWQLYSLVVMMGICIGVYICHRTAKDMGTHDHGSIVWDGLSGCGSPAWRYRRLTGNGSPPVCDLPHF
jgi:phosphatidylglycerophosphatase A